MLAIGNGETITDGKRVFILEPSGFKFFMFGRDADHHVSEEVLDALVRSKHEKF